MHKKVIVSGVILVLVWIGVAYLLPGEQKISESIWINAPEKIVFNQVEDLHNWSKWSEFLRKDPEIQLKFFNHGVGEASGFEWRSYNRKIGEGTLKILRSVKYGSITFQMNSDLHGEFVNTMTFGVENDGVRLAWSSVWDLGNDPVKRWVGFFRREKMKTKLGTDLQFLNAVSLAVKNSNQYIVEKAQLEPFLFASMRQKVSMNEISIKMAEMYGQISEYLAEENTTMSGMPFAIYHLMNEIEIDLECGLPIPAEIRDGKGVRSGSFPTTKCAIVDYYGDYMNLESGHEAIQNWIQVHGFSITGAPMEVYLSDPGTEPDPSRWLTRIYYPVD